MINQVLLNCTVVSPGAVLALESHHIHGTTPCTEAERWGTHSPLCALKNDEGKWLYNPGYFSGRSVSLTADSSHSKQCCALRRVLVRRGEDISCLWASQFWVMANGALSLNPSQTQTRGTFNRDNLQQPNVGSQKLAEVLPSVSSTSSDSRIFWWSWMTGRLHVELYIFMSKTKNNQIVSSYNCPHKIKISRLFSLSSVVGTELSYIHRALQAQSQGGQCQEGCISRNKWLMALFP